jgi:hypothetical protein
MLALLRGEHESRVSSALEGLRYLVATGEALPPSTAKRRIYTFPDGRLSMRMDQLSVPMTSGTNSYHCLARDKFVP